MRNFRAFDMRGVQVALKQTDPVHSPLPAGHLRAPRSALPQLSLSKSLTLYMLGMMQRGRSMASSGGACQS